MAITLPDIASRASWGARFDDGDLTLTGPAHDVFLHHSVTVQLAATASIAAEREQMRSIEGVGESRFGTGISYNVVVFPSGRPYAGVSWNRRGTHTGGRNSTARSICLAGNYDIYLPTNAQIATARRIYHGGKGRLWRADADIYGHRDVKSTACPGRHAYDRLGDIRDGAVFVGNPKPPTQLDPTPAPGRPNLLVDGRWGSATTMALQNELGTTVDGVVSSQALRWKEPNPGLTTGWQWVRDPKGSRLIAAMQRRIGAHDDGILGPDSIRALQRHLSVRAVDGEIWNPSETVRQLQHRLNDGKF
jgi:hypothetical protein